MLPAAAGAGSPPSGPVVSGLLTAPVTGPHPLLDPAARDARAVAGGRREAGRVPLVIGDVPREPKAFQQRGDLREQIEESLREGRRAAVCSLAGARGVGKTHLAASYARASIDEGVPVAWIDAETSEQLLSGLDLMAQQLGLGAEGDQAPVASQVKRWLQARREPYLIVLDNAVSLDAVGPLLPAYGPARVLITTNNPAFERVADLVPVDRFTRPEALAYLRQRVGPGDREGARRLVQELDCLPLALSIAAGRLKGPPPLSYDAYLARLRDTPLDEWLARPEGEPYPRGVAETILLAVAGLTEQAATLLGELSVLSPAGVSRELLGGEDDRALAELAAESLVTFSRDGATVITHRLVQRVLRDAARRRGDLAGLLRGATGRLEGVGRITVEDAWNRHATIVETAAHGEALWEHVRPHLDADRANEEMYTLADDLLVVRHQTGYLLNELTDGIRAISIYEAVVAGRELVLGADHLDTLVSRHNLAYAYGTTGRLDEAIDLFERVAASRVSALGEHDQSTLITQNQLAATYSGAGRVEEAVALLERVVAAQTELLGADHLDTLVSRHNLALVYEAAGRVDEAIELFERVVEDQERVEGAETRSTLITRNQLAATYNGAGRVEEAIALLERVVAAQTELFGADHPDTLISRHNLAGVYRSAGRVAEAVELLEAVLAGMERAMGSEHPETRNTRSALEWTRSQLPGDQ
ncbi:tetratricopeptide repeat protein [Nonomuraea sp. NPDC046570]|uniref:tetratricopeptide repeat protein n=1 Tax=Nonomuraea sp. NPDC046570 TaxID=3155255 RepID=UPI0033C330BF